jgi:hypothetical protein
VSHAGLINTVEHAMKVTGIKKNKFCNWWISHFGE